MEDDEEMFSFVGGKLKMRGNSCNYVKRTEKPNSHATTRWMNKKKRKKKANYGKVGIKIFGIDP